MTYCSHECFVFVMNTTILFVIDRNVTTKYQLPRPYTNKHQLVASASLAQSVLSSISSSAVENHQCLFSKSDFVRWITPTPANTALNPLLLRKQQSLLLSDPPTPHSV